MLNFVHEDQLIGGRTSSPSVMTSISDLMSLLNQLTESQLKDARNVIRLLLKEYVSTDRAYNKNVVSVHLPPMHNYLIRHHAKTNSTTVSAVLRNLIAEYLERHKG